MEALAVYTNRYLYGRQPFWNEIALDHKEAAVVYSFGKVLLVVLDDCRGIERMFHSSAAWKKHVDQGRCFEHIPLKLMKLLDRMLKKHWKKRPKLAEVVSVLRACEEVGRMGCWQLPVKKYVPKPSGLLWSLPDAQTMEDEDEELEEELFYC
jgi:hypothetical protein